ncbi:MAG: hypothetical protein JWN14_4292 [Chthonomonadales bacterium]|nr:hypothetical protein [Chthonomonadales bacterium]
MSLISEPAWRYFLFMGFICTYCLFRAIAPLYTHYHQKGQRIRKLAERALQQHQAEERLDTRIKVEIPVMSLRKRLRITLEVGTASFLFLLSLGWGVRLLQTAIHTHRGIVAASERDEYRAMTEYQLALKSNPVASKIHWSFDAMQSEQDRQIGDLSTAQVYARLHPNNAEACNNLGNVYMGLKRYKEAIKAYRNGIMLLPNLSNLHNNLGAALSADTQVEAAIDEFQRASALDPYNGLFHSNLGDVYYAQNNLTRAEEEYRFAIHFTPALTQPYWRLSEILAKEGHYEEAKAPLQTLIEQSHMPEDAGIIAQARAAIIALK